ncbi:hypothetical protein BH10PLA2_BH10PLA2_11260 [soil metagenome]
MVMDGQVRALRVWFHEREASLLLAAMKTGMDRKTARKYRRGKLPSERTGEHDWRMRPDVFADAWSEMPIRLELSPGLESKTLFEDLQRRFPGKLQDGQLRSLQRRVKRWRALEGPDQEVFFAQKHHSGHLGPLTSPTGRVCRSRSPACRLALRVNLHELVARDGLL